MAGSDALWREPTETEIAEAARGTARMAADLIDKRGWRNRAGNGESGGPLCIMAAIGEASEDYPPKVHGMAYMSVKQVLGIPHPDGSLSQWNDERCQDQGEAVRALREAAGRMRQGGEA